MRQPNLPLEPKKPLPTVHLIHGDCLDVMPTLPEKSVQMVFADLPYAATVASWDVLIDLPSFWRSARKCCASSCQFLFTANMRLAAALLQSNPGKFRYDLIWHKGRPTGSLNAKRAFLRAHEIIMLFNDTMSAHYSPQMIVGKKYCVTTKSRNSKIYAMKEYLADNSHTGTSRYPRSVIACDESDLRNDTLNGRKKSRFHPTQKPVALVEYLIRTYANEGDTVLDPTAGSGTTAIACLRTGRNFIGIEKDKTYFDVASKRIADEQDRLSNEIE